MKYREQKRNISGIEGCRKTKAEKIKENKKQDKKIEQTTGKRPWCERDVWNHNAEFPGALYELGKQ